LRDFDDGARRGNANDHSGNQVQSALTYRGHLFVLILFESTLSITYCSTIHDILKISSTHGKLVNSEKKSKLNIGSVFDLDPVV